MTDPTSDQIDWETVEGAVRRGVTEYSRAHLIPANGLCGEAPQYQRRMAENWGAVVAPFVTACIREDLRKAALPLSGEDRRAIGVDSLAERTADAMDQGDR